MFVVCVFEETIGKPGINRFIVRQRKQAFREDRQPFFDLLKREALLDGCGRFAHSMNCRAAIGGPLHNVLYAISIEGNN